MRLPLPLLVLAALAPGAAAEDLPGWPAEMTRACLDDARDDAEYRACYAATRAALDTAIAAELARLERLAATNPEPEAAEMTRLIRAVAEARSRAAGLECAFETFESRDGSAHDLHFAPCLIAKRAGLLGYLSQQGRLP
jgi:hypothetical protein